MQYTPSFSLTLKREEPFHWFVTSGIYIALRIKALSYQMLVMFVKITIYLYLLSLFLAAVIIIKLPILLLWFMLKPVSLQWHS